MSRHFSRVQFVAELVQYNTASLNLSISN
jgi:hypothetical protein